MVSFKLERISVGGILKVHGRVEGENRCLSASHHVPFLLPVA
jgi:hypothetical protein